MKREKSPSTQWINNLDRPEDKEQFLESLRLSRHVLERLKEMLESRQGALRRSMESTNYFILPSWRERQASALGELRALQHIINLLGV